VAAATAAINAHSTSNLNHQNDPIQYDNNIHYVRQSQPIPQQQYHLNISNSSSPKQPQQASASLSCNSNSPKQIQITPTSSLTKQQIQYQQQNAAAAAAASAAAEYFEQQLKMQQHKYMDLEQQFRLNVEQIKELKEKVNSLNEINRKLYEENQQFKERNIEQRQQIEQFHVLFQENQQKHERALIEIKKERDQHDIEIKRRSQENFHIVNSLKDKLDSIKLNETNLSDELNKFKIDLQQEKNKSELLEKKCKLLEKDASLLKDSCNLEKNEYEAKLSDLVQQIEQNKKKYANEKQKSEDAHNKEKNELKTQLGTLEHKLEEMIKEKAQLQCKYGQLVESNRELNTLVQNKEAFNQQKNEEHSSKLDFYMKKCSDLEKQISDSDENHKRDTEEWKKFQADLQTAVRVANDFLNEAEEKMVKMKEDYTKAKESEEQLNTEIEKLKKRLAIYENTKSTKNIGNYYFKLFVFSHYICISFKQKTKNLLQMVYLHPLLSHHWYEI
jgi:hypothetical protein